MAQTNTDDPPSDPYPALALAYEAALPGYDSTMKRIEVIEGRIRSLLTLALTAAVGVPALVRNTASTPTWPALLSWSSFVFLLAMAAFITAACFGLTAHWNTALKILDPRKLWERVGL